MQEPSTTIDGSQGTGTQTGSAVGSHIVIPVQPVSTDGSQTIGSEVVVAIYILKSVHFLVFKTNNNFH